MALIGIMDSGAGGLSVFREIKKVLPEERFVYFSDNAYCPYGEKTPEQIRERCRRISSMMVEKGAEAMVIACNTATSAAIAALREEFDIPFVGMEPAVKPAALGTGSGVIGVLATAGTLKGSKYLCTKGRFEDDVRIEEHVGKGFVELVEACELSGDHAEEVVRASLYPLLDAGADTIVLGCTHYPFLLQTLEKVAAAYKPSGRSDGSAYGAGKVRFIDPAPAVARQLVNVLTREGIATTDPEPGVEILSSGPSASLKKLYQLITNN